MQPISSKFLIDFSPLFDGLLEKFRSGVNNIKATNDMNSNGHSVEETVVQRAKHDHDFRIGLLNEAAECLSNNEANVAKTLLRDYLKAVPRFSELCDALNKISNAPSHSDIENLSQIIIAMHQYEESKLVADTKRGKSI